MVTYCDKDLQIKYLKKQIQFLCQISRSNKRLAKIQKSILHEILIHRWKSVLGTIGLGENFQIHCRITDLLELGNIFNLSQLDDYCEEQIAKTFDKVLEEVFAKINVLYTKKITFGLYGFGIRGKRMLEQYETMADEGKINWKLMAVIDKNADKINR